jgi:hypothetical protein
MIAGAKKELISMESRELKGPFFNKLLRKCYNKNKSIIAHLV